MTQKEASNEASFWFVTNQKALKRHIYAFL